jgi:hypothetical protein
MFTQEKLLEIPGTEVFAKDGRLGIREGNITNIVEEPKVITVGALRRALVNRGWLIDCHDIFVSGEMGLSRKKVRTIKDIKETREIPEYNRNSQESEFISLEHPNLQGPDPELGDNDALENYLYELGEYTKLFNKHIMIKEDNIGEYGHLVSSRDVLRGTSEICLLCPKDGSYTNIVNLNSIQGSPIQIRVGVAYSKGTTLYSRDTVLVGDPSNTNYVTSGPSDFKLEYSDGCLRVFPDSPEVTECVISYCYLTYECLI